MKHLDLFSGIGGFAYAAREVWGEEYECIGFVEIDRFCQEVLKKRFPGCRIWGDIRTITDTNAGGLQEQGAAEQADRVGQYDEAATDPSSNGLEEQGLRYEDKQSTEQIEAGSGSRGAVARCHESTIDLLTGGFPCQPFSHAGKRKGTSDNRYLWPEMLRVIRLFRPRWVIAENVYGIINIEGGMVFEQVCLDLENEGYEVQPFIIPAVAVNAPHRRDRVWIVANAQIMPELQLGELHAGKCEIDNREDRVQGESGRSTCDFNATDTKDTNWKRHEESEDNPRGQGQETGGQVCSDWEHDWYSVALRTCVRRVDDGIPARVDGLKLSAARHRVERLKALGNAIVPQIAVEIMRCIRDGDNGKQ